MTFVVRLVQVLLALLAVLVAGAFIMALGSRDTGLVEKMVLLLVAALCALGASTSRASLLGFEFAATCHDSRLAATVSGGTYSLLPLRGEETQGCAPRAVPDT